MSHITKGTAIVTITLRIEGLGTWGASASIGQVYDQATNVAIQRIRERIKEIPSMSIINIDTHCKIILTEEEQS